MHARIYRQGVDPIQTELTSRGIVVNAAKKKEREAHCRNISTSDIIGYYSVKNVQKNVKKIFSQIPATVSSSVVIVGSTLWLGVPLIVQESVLFVTVL